ncbi:ribosomal protection-like ABC-F family protein [Latilactobacillus graminis]|uniref:ABC transporter family protein n=2 Tax=Latilactobacillus graminis TaxID=60519 RepID=A0AA89L481_9LACO|nr:ABC-F type ribosomal protection protein [Latilactobacillus graminis]KRM20537.1 ABC transporter family protein [Latilactobacillus graminis DSM 20719]QFP80214.1 ABC-F type ribosomal protection protein [Latilactobacillus graminis]
MGTIQFKALTFNYPDQTQPLFDHVTLQFDASWKLGLIGRNGRGKTTLLKLLQHQLPFTGQLVTDLQFQYFPQAIPDSTQMTRDILMQLGQLDDATFWQVERELRLLQVAPELVWQPFNALSPGEQTKMLLALLFIDDAHFQLIDEPTNHLDQQGRQVVASYLHQKAGFIVISHDRSFLDQVIDHVLAINRADITVHQGNYQTWQVAHNQQTAYEQQQNRQLKGDIKRLTKTAHQKAQWSHAAEKGKNAASVKTESANLDKGFIGHRAAKVMKRATTMANRAEKAINAKQQLFKNVEITAPLSLNQRPLKPRQTVISADQLVLQQGGRSLNQPLSFTLQAGQQVALTGINGAGKSTLLKALLTLPNTDHITSGQLKLNPQLKISYLPQDFDHLSGSLAKFAAAKHVTHEQLLSMLRKLGFERALFNHDLATMSMGQKRKVALARSLCEEADCYLWDEPLNYLDVITREQIQTMVANQQPTLLFIEHDVAFVTAVATHTYALRPD